MGFEGYEKKGPKH